jgi:hypothetical protein
MRRFLVQMKATSFFDQPAAWIGFAASLLLMTFRDYLEVDVAAGRLSRRQPAAG